jgi:hypothetical protein
METSSSIWEILDEGKLLLPFEGGHSSHIRDSILIEMSEDTDDGTFPRVSDYKRFVNSLEDQGTSYFINRLTRKRNKLKVDFCGATITRRADYHSEAIIEFKDPIKVVMGYVGERPIIEEVKKIEGEFVHDWYWKKNGRQKEVANGFEIWFNITKYIE